MGAFGSFKNFMDKPSKNHLAEANGQEAIDELAVKRAQRELEAQEQHQANTGKLGKAALNGEFVIPANVQDYKEPKSEDDEAKKDEDTNQVAELGNAEQFPDAPHGDTLEVPDFEPTVTKAEGVARENAEVKDDEQIAA